MAETASRTIEETTALLGYNYGLWKEYEGEKDQCKTEFYEHIRQILDKEGAAEKLYTTTFAPSETEEQVLARIERFNPGWKIDEWRAVDGQYECILTEDIMLKPFTYVNKDDGMVYARSVRQGPAQLDDEYMAVADPDLYKEITFELPWGERVAPPLKTLDPKTLARVQRFIYKGKPSVALVAPRQAKPEELVD